VQRHLEYAESLPCLLEVPAVRTYGVDRLAASTDVPVPEAVRVGVALRILKPISLVAMRMRGEDHVDARVVENVHQRLPHR
jgi:hypothetical protein